MPLPLNDFLTRLSSTGLVPGESLQTLLETLPSEKKTDGEQLARELVRQKVLTPYQAKAIYESKGQALVLGDYVVLDKIGAGGMGQVFKAQHRRMKRLVAIKLLPPALTRDAAAVKRFEREVEAAAKLTHPNIVIAHDAGCSPDGQHYLVMEYVEGSDLSSYVKQRGPLTPLTAIRCLLQAAQGLAFAHEKGVVHRDIKPGNLLVDAKGTVKVLDMGLARLDSAGERQDELTGTGQIMGTVDYMAPEQALDTKHADARADIYSLGITLWYLLSGKPAYAGETAVAKLMAHQQRPIPLLSTVCPQASPRLQTVFAKMIAKKPEDRYQSMMEVVAALEACRLEEGTSPTVSLDRPAELSSATTPKNPTAIGFEQMLVLAPPPPTQHEETLTSAAAEVGTDPQTQQSLAYVTRPVVSPRANRLPFKWIAAGLGGLLLVALGIWVIIRDKDGKEVAKIKVPDGGTATIENPSQSPLAPVGGEELGGESPPIAKAPFNAKQAKAHQEAWAKHLGVRVETTNSVGAKMVLIPPGEFLMGSSDADIALALKIAEETKLHPNGVDRIQEERPQHLVRITKPFRLGMHEVTIGQFAKFVEHSGYKTQAEEFGGTSDVTKADDPRINPAKMKLNWRTPGYQVNENSPVTQVSWNDAVMFCNWLSEQEKLAPSYARDSNNWTLVTQPQGYRLPTEAEWEYACRAGTTTQYSFGDDWKVLEKFGWSKTNDGGRSRGVGLLLANPFGLYDMHGNVWEWCHDWHDVRWYERSAPDNPSGPPGASYKICRGGSWPHSPAYCRSANREFFLPSYRGDSRGFRVALSGDALSAVIPSQTVPAVAPPVTKPTAVPPPVAKNPFDAEQAKSHQEAWAKHLGVKVETTNSVGARMILIPPGEFLMGSSDEDVARALKIVEETKSDAGGGQRIQEERPQHLVRISKPFRLGIHEVTISQFEKFIEQSGYKTQAEEFGGNSDATKADDPRVTPESKKINWRTPGYEVGENSPVTQVTWNDAVAFCNWLSEQENLTPSYVRDGASWELLAQPQGYRLPTEAEWEYACRAGTTTQYSFGDDWKEFDKFGWSNVNAGGRSRGVGLLSANPFGLYDMHGNVWEWCHDGYDDKWYSRSPSDDPRGPLRASGRVYRGGGGDLAPAYGRSSYRDSNNGASAYRYNARGFRVAISGEALHAAAKTPIVPAVVPPVTKPTALIPPIAKAPFSLAQAKAHQEAWAGHLQVKVEITNCVGAKMALIPPGEFQMGSSDEDIALALKIAEETKQDAGIAKLIQDERPQHLVRITKPFRLGMHEVTIGQFRKFVEQSAYKTQAEEFGGNSDITNADDPRVTPESKQINWRKPGIEISENSPVVQVSWNDAVAFCNWLSKEEKLEPSYVRDGGSWALVAQPQGYRLPTEAEWEYACRAGTTTPYSFGDDWKDLDKFGWSQKNAEGRPGRVGLLAANPFGLFDMHGNVWEWCHDWYDASWYGQTPSDDPTGPLGALSRVYRGGGWNAPPADCRSSYRFNLSTPAYRDYHRGFRVALSGDAVHAAAK